MYYSVHYGRWIELHWWIRDQHNVLRSLQERESLLVHGGQPVSGKARQFGCFRRQCTQSR